MNQGMLGVERVSDRRSCGILTRNFSQKTSEREEREKNGD
jgi:hypothetical protein